MNNNRINGTPPPRSSGRSCIDLILKITQTCTTPFLLPFPKERQFLYSDRNKFAVDLFAHLFVFGTLLCYPSPPLPPAQVTGRPPVAKQRCPIGYHYWPLRERIAKTSTSSLSKDHKANFSAIFHSCFRRGHFVTAA